MAENKPKKKKNRKVRYRKITFKLTDTQKKALDRVSARLKTTPNRLMKKAIREYLQRYKDALAAEDIVSINQLKLFDDAFFEDPDELDEPDDLEMDETSPDEDEDADEDDDEEDEAEEKDQEE